MKKTAVIIFALILCLSSAVYGSEAAPDVIYSWSSNEKVVSLTFDDGPHPYRTDEILDILDEYGIKATFFFIGQNVRDYPNAVPRVMAAGHEIGNHTFTHRNLQTLCYSDLVKEIEDTEEALIELVGYEPKLLRPPEGKFSDDVIRASKEKGYSIICWSIDTLDWAHNPTENIVHEVLDSVEAGDIILFHDFVSGESPTPAALRMIIPTLIERGYRFVTVSELMGE